MTQLITRRALPFLVSSLSSFSSSAFSSAPPSTLRRNIFNQAISISSNFDGGNIMEETHGSSEDEVLLRSKRDLFTDLEQVQHMQWFSFRASGAISDSTRFSILNAGEASYAPAWKGYTVCASFDNEDCEYFRQRGTYCSDH
jgi:hypothetical protein